MSRKQSTKAALRSLEVRPSKGRGQNFVVNPAVIAEIIEFGDPRPEDIILEIGPGLGALTEALVRTGAAVSVIEIEHQFCKALRQRFPEMKVIESDARSVDLSEFGSKLVVFANVPYVFSTDIIFHLLAHAKVVQRAVLLLQREFAARLAAPPGGRTYGTISVACQLRANMRLGPVIPGEAFHPAPKVESQLIELHLLQEPRVPVKDWNWLEIVVKAAFSQRRKKIVNSLCSSGRFSRAQVDQALAKLDIDPGLRAEALAPEIYVQLAETLV